MIFRVLSAIAVIVGIAFLLDLNPERVTSDILDLISPRESLSEEAKNLRVNKRRHRLYTAIMDFKQALENCGKAKQFSNICFLSVLFFAIGIVLSFVINNVFMIPVFSITGALIPFFYTVKMLSYFEKQTKDELETTLSIITNSYIRSDDIILAVKENEEYIKPPIREIFKTFVIEATALSSSTKRALYKLKEKINNDIFSEWCDALIACQDDRTLKDTLPPIVSKLTDVRIVNNELNTMLSSVRMEYYMMILLLVGSIPLLYIINKSWFHTLIFGMAGKVMLGFSGVVILVTFLLLLKFTKPIEYKR